MPETAEAPRQSASQRAAATTRGTGRDNDSHVASQTSVDRRIEVRTVRPPAAGTLTGLGEAFQGPGQFGTAQLSIPLIVTPARGLEPQLTLSYDSTAGNGVFGQGAHVATSSVALATNRRLPKYDGSDAFSLDGAELVRVPDSRQARTAGGRSFTVEIYRPRHESAFQRIEYWRPEDGGVGFWRTLSRADEIAVYGTGASTRISDPEAPSRVFEWLIEARYDPRGNAERYHYKREDRVGVPLSAAELARHHEANLYPARIAYGNANPFTPADPLDLPDGPWLFDVLFDYGEYRINPDNDSPATPVAPWICRPDSFSVYTAGFERRTHRLCRNVLMVHHFPLELGADDVLVHVMALRYDENHYASRLVSIGSEGWWYVAGRPSGKRYTVKSLPALRLGWSDLPARPPTFAPLEVAPASALPRFGAPPPYALVDLDGSGLPGVLYADGATVAYTAPTLVTADLDAAVIYQAVPFSAFPIARIADGDAALIDLDGDGRLSLSWSTRALDGFYPRREDGGWQTFRPFSQTLLDRGSPAAQFADLTGDGRADRVRVDSDELAYNRNLGRDGFAPLTRRAREHGLPLTAVPPPGEDVRFADVLGGGTTPAVLVRSGSLRCWPNLGYGRFATPIDLAAPRWPDTIDAERVLLADLTGTGCADLVIALTDRLRVHRNRAGNEFDADAIEIMLPTPLRSIAQLRSADMAGMGCQALVFTSDEPAPRHWVCDLADGQRPGLVTSYDDGRGRVVQLRYASSARFQLLDRLKGRRWITTLAVPVPVVSRVEQADEVASVTRVIDYHYSHGYFDPAEREFRGFGLVEMHERDAPRPSPAQSVGDVVPLVKREWYHTGAMLAAETLEEAFAREYWQGDSEALPMPPSCFDWQQTTPDAATWREAVSALAGTLLRSEIFAATDPEAPFTVDAGNALVRLEQPRVAGQKAVFLVTPREHVTSSYDGAADDPRVHHEVTLEVDAWGDVALACQVDYARRPDRPNMIPEQKRIWITAARHETVAPRQGPDLWLVGLPWQDRRWELPHPPAPTVRGLYYDFAALLAAVNAAIRPGGDAALLQWSRLVYVGQEGSEAPPAAVTAQALVLRDELATFDAEELATQFRDAEPPGGLTPFLAAQGYAADPGNGLWWNPGLTQIHGSADAFFVPIAARDPFAMRKDGRPGVVTAYAYDAYHLMITGTTASSTGDDVLPEVTAALSIDYRTLQVTSLRDSNWRIHEVLLDPLGDVIATSDRGFEWRNGAPVQVGFGPLPLNDPAQWPQPADTAALIQDPARYLGAAASFHFNDWESWQRAREPIHAVAVTAQAFPDDANAAEPHLVITFADGFGRQLQQKARTEPGIAHRPDGTLNATAVERWATTGGRHYNGLGLPDREYEPYFTDHWRYTADAALNRLGATLILSYDAVGRLVRTDYPKGDMPAAFFTLVIRTPWSEAHWDQDDTIKASNYYRRYIHPGGGPPLPPLEREALIKAAAFDGTPRIDHLDPRGLAVRVEELLTSADAPVTSLVTVHAYDADGLKSAEADPRQAAAGRWNLRFDYALGGQVVRTESVDGGTSWLLNDVVDKAAYTHDLRGTSVIRDHDGRHRQIITKVWARDAAAPIIVERFIYGDSLDATGATPITAPDRRNLMGELCVTFDGAGRTDVTAKALSGGIADETVRLVRDARAVADWQAAAAENWAALFAALDPKLEPERFPIAAHFNALGQIVARIEPGGTTVLWRYRRDGLLAQVLAARPDEPARAYLDATDYNAKGQRLWSTFGAGEGGLFRTEYRYDPDDFRLTGIATTRQRDALRLQDLTYWADPVGNITAVTDAAAPASRVFHGNQDITPDQDFTYDSLYRLTANTGRAHVAYSLAMAADGRYGPYFPPPSRQDGGALERYRMSYEYDAAANLWFTRYSAASSQWTQTLTIAPDSNRGAVTGGSLEGMFDASGNQLKFQAGASARLAWTWADRLASVTLVERHDGEPDAQYYGYDAEGIRVRKLTRRLVGGTMVADETITLGEYAIHRELRDGIVVSEWRSSRLMDADRCIAELVDWTVGTPPDGVEAHQDRYQLGNLIHSSVMEVSGDGRIISYEEFAPFGATVYAAGSSLSEVSLKSYRYAAHERDQATGLYYYGARYYAPWLCRWLSPDPAGDVDGLNLYAFVGGNPVSHTDIDGLCKTKQSAKKKQKTTKPKAKNTSQSSNAVQPIKRMGFTSEANRLKKKGTDLAHRYSFQSIARDVVTASNDPKKKTGYVQLMKTIAGPDPILVKQIDAFAKQKTITQSDAREIARSMNSAKNNLRPGDSGRNRSLKANFDSGTAASKTRKRRRSPSPISKKIITQALEIGEELTFHAPQGTIMTSTDPNGMDTKDIIASISPLVSGSITSQVVGNQFIIKMT